MQKPARVVFIFTALVLAVLSSSVYAAIVTTYSIESATGSEWWPCSWVSPSGDVWSFYQADRDTSGRNIVAKKMNSTVPGAEQTIIDGDGVGWNEPVIRGTAGYLVARSDVYKARVINLNNSNSVVYETSGSAYEPRIYNKTLVYGTNNAIYMVRDVTTSSAPVQIAFGSGWMGHPDIEGDYITYQWNDSSSADHNNVYLYQISTGTTTQLSTTGCTGAAHVGGGYVAYQNWASGNKIYLYNIAQKTTILVKDGGYFSDTVPGPILNDNYMVFGTDNYLSGSGGDVIGYDIASRKMFPIAIGNTSEWGATISGNRVCYGNNTGTTDTIYGAVLTGDSPSGRIAGTITLKDFAGDVSLAPVRIELIQDSQVITSQYVQAGNYTLSLVPPGTYSVRFSACGWIRKVLSPVTITASNTTQVNVSLFNGDTDGSGTTDLNDISIIDKNYGQFSDSDPGLLNGSFELGINPGSQTGMSAVDSTTITGWTLSTGTCDYVGTAWSASDGVRSVDLNGYNSGGIEQAISVTRGVRYRLYFHMAGNNTASSAYTYPVKTLNVNISGCATASGGYSVDITGTSPANMSWQVKTLDFTATNTGKAVLRFASTFTPSGSDGSGHAYAWYGPAVDNIRLIPIGYAETVDIIAIADTNLFAKKDNLVWQLRDVTFSNAGGPLSATLAITSPDDTVTYISQSLGVLRSGTTTSRLNFPDPAESLPVKLKLVDQVGVVLVSKDYVIQPQPHWEVYIIPGSHSDWGWGFSTKEAMDMNLDVFEKALSALNSDSDYKYTVESAAIIKYYCEKHPDRIDSIRNYLASGRLEVSAFWVLPETGIWDGESYIRTITLAKNYMQEQFGYEPVTIQNHDVPGYPRQLGQIFNKSDIAGFIWCRGSGTPAPLYQEVSLDGSNQLSYLVPHSWLYSMGFALGLTDGTSEVMDKLMPYLDSLNNSSWPVKKILVPLEHDWSYPYPTITDVARKWNAQYAYPKLIVSTPREYFSSFGSQDVTSRNYNYLSEDWAVGEVAFSPLINSQRKAETSLLNAEKFATLACLVNGNSYPFGKIQEGWQELALTYDHNFGDQHDPLNYKERYSLIEKAKITADTIAASSLSSLACSINKTGSGTAIVVFNPLFFYRQDIVEVQVTLPSGGLALTDANGNSVPYQTESTGDKSILRFQAEVPSLGYATYYLSSGTPASAPAELKSSTNTIENSYYRVTVDAVSGVLTSIWDKTLSKELLDNGAPCAGNELLVDRSFKYGGITINSEDTLAQQSGLDMASERRHPIDTYLMWRQKNNAAAVSIEKNNLFARITVSGSVLNSTYSQKITLYPGSKRIYIDNKVDWQGRNHAKVKFALPLSISNPTLTIGEPFGARSMQNTPSCSVQKWLEVNNGSWGVSVATSGQCGFVGSTLYPVILWDEKTWTPNEGAYWFCPKPWTYNYQCVLTSHSGSWQSGSAWRLGFQQDTPLVALAAEPAAGTLPQRASFLSCPSQTIVPTVFKVADDRKGVVLRYYEASGTNVSASFTLSNYLSDKLTEAWASNITEEKQNQLTMSSGTVSLDAPAYTIGDIRFEGTSVNPVSVESYESSPMIFAPYTKAEIAAEPYFTSTEYTHNPGFETGNRFIDGYGPYPDNWDGIHGGVHNWGTGDAQTTLINQSSLSHSGSRCVEITLSNALRGAGAQFCQDVAVTSEMLGKVVRFSCYVKSTRPNAGLCLEAWNSSSVKLATNFSKLAPYGDWTYYYIDLIVPTDAVSLSLGIRAVDSGEGEIYFDDASLRLFNDYTGWEQSVNPK